MNIYLEIEGHMSYFKTVKKSAPLPQPGDRMVINNGSPYLVSGRTFTYGSMEDDPVEATLILDTCKSKYDV